MKSIVPAICISWIFYIRDQRSGQFRDLPMLTRAPLGYSAERDPLGGHILPPCLTPELIGAARRARRRSKALDVKIPMHIKNFI